MFLSTGRRYTGLPLAPDEARFIHGRPDYLEAYEEFFACQLEFGCESNELVMPAEARDVPLLSADERLHPHLLRMAENMLAALPTRRPFSEQVRQLVAEHLAGPGPGLERIAEQMGTSPTTLKRRLRDEGTTHSALVDEVRKELARHLLTRSDAALSEVAFLLGFSRDTAFHRAFRRWFDTSPAEFRRRERRASVPPSPLAQHLKR
jgi:AraC-like DNA-binding protein